MTVLLQILISGLTTGAVYALVALGFTMIFNVSRVLNLAQGAFLTYGSLVTYTLLVERGLPYWLAAAVGVAAAASLGVLIDRLGLGRAYGQGGLAPLLVITMGLSILLEGVAQTVWGTVPVRLPSLLGDAPVRLGALAVAPQSLVILAVLVVVAGAAALFFARTTLGVTMRAVADNRMAAGMIGVDVQRTSALAFAIAGVVGAIGGILLAPLAFTGYDSGTLVGLKGSVGAIIGGMYSPMGALAGGLLIGVVESLGIGYVSSLFNNTVTFVALMAVLMARSFLRPPHLEAARTQRTRYHAVAGRGRLWQGLLVSGGLLAVLPRVLPNDYMLSVATLIGVLAIAVIGLDLLKGVAGMLSLSQGAFLGLAAYGSAILTTRLGWPPLAALMVMAAVSAAVAAALAASSVRLEGYNLALATLGFSVIAQDLATGLRDLTGGASGIVGIGAFALGPLEIGSGLPMYYLAWGLVLTGGLLMRSLRRSQAGRALEALGQQEAAAAAIGVPVKRSKVFAFVIAAIFASVAGSLYAHLTSFVSPGLAGMGMSVTLLTMLIVGGEGYIWGGVVGAAVIRLVPQVFSFLQGHEMLVEGAVLVLAMKFMPDGLWGAGARLLDRTAAVWTGRRPFAMPGAARERA
ncbi:MAG: ABC transporter permease [Armatimonadota bacterium]|nr:ABC transporter permease [Armatimonadota bacterium]